MRTNKTLDEDRDHPLVMSYEPQPGWLDPVRSILPRASGRHERARSQLLAAAIDAAIDNASVSCSRRRQHYAERGKRYDQHLDLYTFDSIVPNVDLLANHGLLHSEIAAADPTSGRQSTFRATPFLIEALGDTPPLAAKRKPRALIQLRNADKLPVDYRGTDNTTRMQRHLVRINEMVESVTLEVPPDVGERRGDLLKIGDSTVNLRNISLYRIFNVTFKSGGRFYGHYIQGLPKKARLRITLNGEYVSEPDYRAHHPRILYALAGRPLPGDPCDEVDGWDPYEVDGWERSVAKVALLIIINAPSWQSARGAIMQRFGLGREDTQRLIDELKRLHAPIAGYFGSGAGCWLQWYDSRMAGRILVKATRQGIPVLPVHDSFITPARYENSVRELMSEAFQTVIFGPRAAPPIYPLQQEVNQKPFHIRIESLPSPPPSVVLPFPVLSLSPLCSGKTAFFGDDRRLSFSGQVAVMNARRRRALRQDQLAGLIGISRPTLSNILAGRFGASRQTAERIAEVIATTPAFERQPFLPGLAA